MRNSKEAIKQRIAKRKKLKTERIGLQVHTREEHPPITPSYHDESAFTFNKGASHSTNYRIHPLFSMETFIFKILAAASLVLMVAILFQNPSHKLEPARNIVNNVMESEFQFAAVADWYENTFGKALTFLPESPDQNEVRNEEGYALPANAVIVGNFDEQLQGIIIQTIQDAPVTAMQGGIVEFAGMHEEFGHTVIIQHPDTSETWYGNLGQISVKVYDRIKVGDEIGIVSVQENSNTGEYYFAIKKDKKFIDPVQVIKFE